MPKLKVEKLHTFSGHTDCVYTLTHSNSTNIFFSAGADGQVVKWDIENPDEGKVIAKVDSSIYSLCFHEEKNWLIIGQNFEGIHIINLTNNKLVKSIQLTKSAIFDIKVKKDLLAIACGNGELILLELCNFTSIAKLKLSEKSARSLEIVKGKLFIGYSDHNIRVIDLINYKLIKEWKAHQNSVFSLKYISKTNELLSVGRDAQINSWNIESFQKNIDTIPAHMYTINHIVDNKSETWFASCSMDKSVKIWDTYTKTLLKVIDKQKYPSHGTSINKLLWIDEQKLICCSDDRKITLWNIENAS